MEEKAQYMEKRKRITLVSIGIVILIIIGTATFLLYLNQVPNNRDQDIVEREGLVLMLSSDRYNYYNISSDQPIELTLTLLNNGLDDINITSNFTLEHRRGFSINIIRPDNSTWGIFLSDYMYYKAPEKFPETFILKSGEKIDFSFDLRELDV
ncbi:MAG: hypothetical protein ACFFCW_22455, partial [Candidatus Hodarchaeota archaeon]